MPSALKFIGGGLLTGIGKGLVETGKAKREAALKKIEREFVLERDENQLEGRRGLLKQRLESDREIFGLREEGAKERLKSNLDSRERVASEATESRKNIASQATTSRESIAAGANESREGIASSANKSREKIGAAANTSREAAARTAAGKPTDTTAAEDRIIKRHVELDENGNETVNHEAAAVELEGRGFKKAAAAQRRKAKGIADVDLQQRAEDFADQMVDEQSGAFSFDSSDFKDDGGSRTRFRARMVREFKAKNGGPGAAPPATKPAASGGTPYVGSTPPPGFPDAKRRASDGFWYVKREGKFLRVQNTEANRVSRAKRGPR